MTDKNPDAKPKARPDPFDSNYQPSRRDLEREVDMPGADLKTLDRAFFKTHKPK